MNLISAFVDNPVKVAVAVLMTGMFGIIAMYRMPMQMSPDVERPTISVSTRWPGASPQEIEKEIIKEQEEQLKSVEGVTKMSSECSDSSGSISMEFQVGTNMQEAVLKVNTMLQQVRQYPVDADEPTIRTSNTSDNAIAWFILSARPASDEEIFQLGEDHPDLKEEIGRILRSHNPGLKVVRLRDLALKDDRALQLIPADLDVPKFRKFAEDNIESAFERVSGVADCNVLGGQEQELQIIVDPKKLAARGLTIASIRQALIDDNQDTSAGDFWEGKRRYVVRTLGEYRSLDQVKSQIIESIDGQPVYVEDVAEVQLGYKKPSGFVRRFGVTNIAINCQRESGANVIDVMRGLRAKLAVLNEGPLKREGLVLNQVYDETDYINSAVGLVNQNIILGSALTIIILMLFLHLSARALVFIPLIAISAIAAILISPWIFLVSLVIIFVAGIWFARGALVVSLAIPTSIVGTFLILNFLGRSLNVISLAGLAFAVGMLVDNAVVVLENIYRYHQLGFGRFEAAKRAASEVWGAVLASTLTTVAVFLPVIFLKGEAGQLFVDIALAISAAVSFSLFVSVIVIPTASSRILRVEKNASQNAPSLTQSDAVNSSNELSADNSNSVGTSHKIEATFQKLGTLLTDFIIGINHWIQQSLIRKVMVVFGMFAVALTVGYLLLPKVEYLPQGNRNLVISLINPPPGYNVNQLGKMGSTVEDTLRPYWDYDDLELAENPLDYPEIGDFFYVARGRSIFLGVRARDPLKAGKLIELIQTKLNGKFPGSFVVAFQTSIFGRGLSGGRSIDVEITGPKLKNLVGIGGQILRKVTESFPEGTQARPIPSLDLSSPELHVTTKPQQARDLGINATELGYAVNALIDGAYVSDYFIGGEKIDMVILTSTSYQGNTQDLESQYIATKNMSQPVRLDALADIKLSSGPEQVNHRERQRAITIQVTPPAGLSLEEAIEKINSEVIAPLEDSGKIGVEYQVNMSGTADKLAQTWSALRWNILLAVLITYLLMAALFESWVYPLVIILSVPMGAVGGIIGLKLLGFYLTMRGGTPQSLDVLTMLGFVILIGTVVNNAILIVHQSLNFIREQSMPVDESVLQSIRTRIRPIFMTTLTTVGGLSPLVFFPGAGSELYRGLGSVVLGGLVVSTLFTLVLVPTLFSLMLQIVEQSKQVLGMVHDEEVELTPAVVDNLSGREASSVT